MSVEFAKLYNEAKEKEELLKRLPIEIYESKIKMSQICIDQAVVEFLHHNPRISDLKFSKEFICISFTLDNMVLNPFDITFSSNYNGIMKDLCELRYRLLDLSRMTIDDLKINYKP